jgi:toxin CcdB
MARFDVFSNPEGSGYLLNIQTDLLNDLNTRVVVPLLPADEAPKPARHLNPIFKIGDDDVIMVTQFIATIPISALPIPVSNVGHRSGEIIAALDMLISGF